MRKRKARILCALCWRKGHAAKFCPDNAVGRYRRAMKKRLFTIELEGAC